MLILPPTSQGSSFLIQRAIQTDISGALGNYGQSQTPSFPSQHSLLDRYLLTSSFWLPRSPLSHSWPHCGLNWLSVCSFSHPLPSYLQSMVHGLPVRDQLIEGRQVKVLAEQSQCHQLICWNLEEKVVINLHPQPVSGVPWVSNEFISDDQVHRYFKIK